MIRSKCVRLLMQDKMSPLAVTPEYAAIAKPALPPTASSRTTAAMTPNKRLWTCVSARIPPPMKLWVAQSRPPAVTTSGKVKNPAA